MAYEVTATRRRPQTFEDLVGQEFVVATLKNAIETGKIAHAYLFSGPRGCGKTSSARILAKALNCEKGPNATPCGECNTCREIARGSNLDVIEIDGASNTSVNDVRQIKDEVLFPPNSSRYKIYIIDEVHMLSTSAFNALLKTIEEPPPYVIFIFATTELHKVPATIKSRCQQFNFRLVAPEIVKGLLADAAAEMNIKADDEALYWIARESTGSVRDAYTLFDQVAAFSGDHITFEKIRDKLGLTSVDSLNELCELLIDNNTGIALEKLDGILQSGVSIEQFVINFSDYLRSLILIQNGVTKESLLGQSASRFSQKVLAAWDSIKLERALSMFLQLYRDIRYSLSPRFELELALSRLAFLAGYVSPAEVKKAVDAARNLLLAGAKINPQGLPQQNQGGMNPLSRGGFSRDNTETAFIPNSSNPFDAIRRNITETRPQPQSYVQPATPANQPVHQFDNKPAQQNMPQYAASNATFAPVEPPKPQNYTHAAPQAMQQPQKPMPPAQQSYAQPPVPENSYATPETPHNASHNYQINMQAASFAFDNAGNAPQEKHQNAFPKQNQQFQAEKPVVQSSFQQTYPQAEQQPAFQAAKPEFMQRPQQAPTPQFVQQTQAIQNFGTAASQAFQPEESHFSQYEQFAPDEPPESDYDESYYDDSYEEEHSNVDSALQSFDPTERRAAQPQNQPVQSQPIEQNRGAPQESSDKDSLIEEAVNRISSEKTLIGTALLNAVRWSINGSKITCFIEKPFLKNQLDAERSYISSVFSAINGAPLAFEVELAAHETSAEAQQEDVPEEVNLLCQVFKGKQIPQ